MIPTIGRETLRRAVISALWADEIIVVPDGRAAWDEAQTLLPSGRLKVLSWTDEQPLRELGHPQRNRGMAQASSSWLMFLDDDDEYRQGCDRHIRPHLGVNAPHIFRMRYGNGHPEEGKLLWDEPELRFCNVGTPMLAVPNLPGKLGKWETTDLPGGVGGDFRFIEETCRLQGEPVFVDRVIADVRP